MAKAKVGDTVRILEDNPIGSCLRMGQTATVTMVHAVPINYTKPGTIRVTRGALVVDVNEDAYMVIKEATTDAAPDWVAFLRRR